MMCVLKSVISKQAVFAPSLYQVYCIEVTHTQVFKK